ncbi:hypothetical protein ATO4_04065 [Aurantimonas sp. 22II-16-19i]|nr:hypothetical protein ATO4_04065 [Aurantimonas sp. 22II-16-19i]
MFDPGGRTGPVPRARGDHRQRGAVVLILPCIRHGRIEARGTPARRAAGSDQAGALREASQARHLCQASAGVPAAI